MVHLVSIETFSNRNRIHLPFASRPFPIPIEPRLLSQSNPNVSPFNPGSNRTHPPYPLPSTRAIDISPEISIRRSSACREEGAARPPRPFVGNWRHVCARTWQANMAGFASAPAFRAASRVRVGVTAAVPSTKELRELSDADVEERVAKAKRRLLDLRIKKATRQVRGTRRIGIRSLRGCSNGSTDARTSPCAAGVQTARVCGEQEGGTIHVCCQVVPPCKLALDSKTCPRLALR